MFKDVHHALDVWVASRCPCSEGGLLWKAAISFLSPVINIVQKDWFHADQGHLPLLHIL